METYPIPMVPGPVKVPDEVLSAYLVSYGSGDLETDYLDLYNQTEANLQTLMATRNQVAIQTGEGMIALWGGLKSCIRPGDRVLAIATGVFGYGVADMARSIGASVKTVGIPYNQTIQDWEEIELAIAEFNPKMITAIHCETPSGTLNPIAALGALKEKYHIPLLYVDAVASVGGVPVLADEWKVDLLLGGSQKVLACPPDMSFVAISDRAWEMIDEVNYVGYDALKPFKNAQKDFVFPYTPNWNGTAALYAGTQLILHEGLQHSFERHERVAVFVREELQKLGLQLFPAETAIPSPTVTAVNVPENMTWEALDNGFRSQGLVVGGSYGPLTGKVFRLGHMGTQADLSLAEKTLDVIQKVLK
jgi:aspartate aminotransferase-like enzyme